MRIVVGFLRSPEGRAALQRAIEEARLRDAELLVVHSFKGGPREDEREIVAYREEFERLEQQLQGEDIRYRLKEYVRGNAPDDDLLQFARDEDADLIVIGIRRRSPVGKLVLGSNAQDILLQADCPVLAVKADPEG
jgi:nucleotide-binding universal stress UspA family protein